MQSLLIFDDVTKVSSKGIDQENESSVLSLLTVFWQDLKDASGRFELVFSGESVISLEVECINVLLQDVTRPYYSPSKKRPNHNDI